MFLRFVVWALAIGFASLYLGQYWRLAPNHTDDGLLLGYIHQMSLGELPHYDMIDAYGLFNWVFPVTFYKLAGAKVWGVRLWLLVLKVISVVLAYRMVSRLATPFYGVLGALGLMILLGQAWQSLQTAYAFLTIVPLVLASWHVLLVQPFRRPWLNAVVAAVFTTLTIWTKLNTGLFLFAGGLLVLLCWIGVPQTQPDESPLAQKLQPWIRRARLAGAVAYAALFFHFVRVHFSFMYFVYLIAPLLIVMGWTAFSSYRQPTKSIPVRWLLSTWPAYFLTTAVISLVVLFGYYGFDGAFQYARELAGILGNIHYHYPFPELGKPLLYVGFNENYWPQVPWVFSGAFVVWLLLQRRFGDRTFGADWPRRRAQVSALFVLGLLHSFVLYARSDETHIFQALLLIVPAIFVIFYQIDRMLQQWRPQVGSHFREGLAFAAAIYGSTIAVRPSLDALRPLPGDYQNPHLEHILYRPVFNLHVRNTSQQISDRDWDVLVDNAARYVDSITDENEPILVMSSERFLHYGSRTKSVGGRYAFYFYLISVRLLDRAAFDRVVPRSVITDILNNPPRVIVTSGDSEPIVPDFPEFKALRDEYYTESKKFRHIHVYQRKPGALEQLKQNPVL